MSVYGIKRFWCKNMESEDYRHIRIWSQSIVMSELGMKRCVECRKWTQDTLTSYTPIFHLYVYICIHIFYLYIFHWSIYTYTHTYIYRCVECRKWIQDILTSNAKIFHLHKRKSTLSGRSRVHTHISYAPWRSFPCAL